MNTHIIIDKDTNRPVGLAIEFVTEECKSNLSTFKANCNPEWGWHDAKKEEVFNLVMAEIAQPEAESQPEKKGKK